MSRHRVPRAKQRTMETRPPTDEATSRRMSRQIAKDTGPEVELRRQLRRLGLGYRIEFPLPGIPRRRCDIAFVGAKVAVFVDGCFWHSCPIHATLPVRNGEWWAAKLEANVSRDRDTDVRLRELGWLSVRVWEHEVPAEAARRIAQVVLQRRR